MQAEPGGDLPGIRPTSRRRCDRDRKETLLVVEMFDANRGSRLACSVQHGEPSSDLAAKRIQETVERLFEKYQTKVK
jgi:hypothetical protein